MRKEFRITTKYIMGVMLFFIMVLYGSVTGHAYSAATQILPATVEQPSEGCMLVGVRGEYVADSMAALNRINEIRLEACREGVPNPDNPSVNLTMEDYVPIKWSAELEQIARIRAAEATMVIEHKRPNGKDCFSLRPLNLHDTCETLAWNGASSMLPGIEQWYGEKKAWVTQNKNVITGHYTAMIRPKNTYVGLGCMVSEYAIYKNTLCGRFGYEKNTVDETMAASVKDCIQLVEIQRSAVGYTYLRKLSFGFENQLKVGDTLPYEIVAYVNSMEGNARVLIMDSVVWTSSDENVATVDNYGNVTGIGEGTVTITATSANGFSASVSLTFADDKVEPGDITEPEEGDDDPGTEEVEPGENEGNGEEVGPGEKEEVVESGGNLGMEEKPGGNTVIGEEVGTGGATDNKVETGQETGAASEPNNEVEPASEPDNNVESENKTNNKVAKVRSLKVKADRKKLSITWKKIAGAAGYELQISTKKNFKGAKTIKLGKNKTKYTLKDINGKNKYYVRIRAYKTIKKKGKSKKVYGSWVKVNIKTK